MVSNAPTKSDCIESELKPHKLGYCFKQIGSRTDGTRRKRPHHRVVYAEHHGLEVDEMVGEVDHLCFNRSCINIDHLELVSGAENRKRSHARNPRNHHGENNPKAKMTYRKAVAARHMHRCGMTQQKIADFFGVTQQVISEITLGKRWVS